MSLLGLQASIRNGWGIDKANQDSRYSVKYALADTEQPGDWWRAMPKEKQACCLFLLHHKWFKIELRDDDEQPKPNAAAGPEAKGTAVAD